MTFFVIKFISYKEDRAKIKMKNLIPLRNIIMLVGVAVTLVMLAIFLIFGTSEGKIQSTVMTFLVPALFDGFLRISFYIG